MAYRQTVNSAGPKAGHEPRRFKMFKKSTRLWEAFLATLALSALLATIWLTAPSLEAESASAARQAEQSLFTRAQAIHARIYPIDGHVDVLDNMSPADLAAGHWSQFDLASARRGGLQGAAFAVFAAQRPAGAQNQSLATQEAERKYAAIAGLAQFMPGAVGLARTPTEARELWRQGLFAAIVGMVNGYPLQDPLEEIEIWRARGLSVFGFVHWGNNDLADSSRPSALLGDKGPRFHGLSPLGKSLLRKLNTLGIVADVSQMSREAVLQTVALSEAPVIASHSGIRARVNHPRNLSNEELDAIARKGGLVQVVAYSQYVRPTPTAWFSLPGQLAKEFGLNPADDPVTKLDPKRFAAYDRRLSALHARAPQATLEQYLDSIDYAVRRLGIDHVGIASDFNHGGGVTGWMDSSQSRNVTLELLRRGYTEDQIAKLWSGNFLRVWQAALDHAAGRSVLSSNSRYLRETP